MQYKVHACIKPEQYGRYYALIKERFIAPGIIESVDSISRDGTDTPYM